MHGVILLLFSAIPKHQFAYMTVCVDTYRDPLFSSRQAVMATIQGSAFDVRLAEEKSPMPSVPMSRSNPVGTLHCGPRHPELCGPRHHQGGDPTPESSVRAAGPGCRIKGDLISIIRSRRIAGNSFQPGRRRILSTATFFPHHDDEAAN